MQFPIIWHIGGVPLHAHFVMELIGYASATRLYVALKRRFPSPNLNFHRQIWIVIGCLAGALLGAKLLAIIESIHLYWPYRHDLRVLLSGKTIVGGLAGGWLGVEMVKRDLCITQSTGDRFVFPILLGLCFGRIGCFLTGLPDHTYGIATSLPWGVDFGDGIRRHPTQLYEIVFCLLLACALLWRMRRPWPSGRLFLLCMLGYFSWRFAVEFIKPRETYFGLSPIQIVSFIAACVALRKLLGVPNEATYAGPAIPIPRTDQ